MWDSRIRPTTTSKNQLGGGLSVAARAMSKAKARRPWFRQGMTRPARNGPSLRWPRGGRAVAELLLVLVFVGSVIVFLLVVNRSGDEKKQLTALVRQKELVSGHEVPLGGDEFSCTVTLVRLSAAGSPHSPYYSSRVQFAYRDAGRSDPFLLDITAGDTANWDRIAICRTWTLLSADAALDYLYEHGEIAIAPSELTEQERFSALIDCLSPELQEVTSLDEPLWRCVPGPLQETGIVLITDGKSLKHVHEFKGFPLHRLASDIRSTAQHDDWTLDDPWALLPTNGVGDHALTANEKHAISQALVYRLLDYLTREEFENSSTEAAE